MRRWIIPALAVLCLSMSASASEPPPAYVVPEYPGAVVTADFNGDSLPHVAVACQAFVSVLLGNGDGTFQAAVTFPSSWHTDSLAVGDSDQDGNSDPATSGGILLGQGDGTFDLPWSQSGLSWSDLAVGDMNREGKEDLVGTAGYGCSDYWDWCAGLVTVPPGNGDGTFQPILYSPAGGSGPVALADFDGDARIDLAVATSHGVAVHLGSGDGTLQPVLRFDVAGSWGANAVASADFDGDGLPDLAATGTDDVDGVVSILLNDGIWPALGAPSISISDAAVAEGNSGTSALTLTVSLSAAWSQAVKVDFSTADGTAAASGDYQVTSGTLTIAAGQTSGTITVPVNGDRAFESDETFVVNLDRATNAYLVDLQGVATILDDEPFIASSSGGSKAEGQRQQTTPFPFVVTLSSAYDEAVTVSFATASGWGTASPNDYLALTGSLTFNPGETAKTVTVYAKGDTRREPDETFVLRLYGPSGNARLATTYHSATILNDD